MNKQEYDLCIVGAGIIGLYLAEQIPKNKKILFLEKGSCNSYLDSIHLNKESSESLRSNIQQVGPLFEVNHWEGDRHFLSFMRFSLLGGTANFWGGESLILSKSEYADALGWNGDSDYTKYINQCIRALNYLNKNIHEIKNIKECEIYEDKFYYAKNFSIRNKLKNFFNDKHGNVKIIYKANVIEFDNQSITYLKEDGTFNRIYAKKFVISNGGIESVKLLMQNSRYSKIEAMGSGYEEVLHGQVGWIPDHISHIKSLKLIQGNKLCIRGGVQFQGKKYSYVTRFESAVRFERIKTWARNIYRTILFSSYRRNKINIGIDKYFYNKVKVWLCIQGYGYSSDNKIYTGNDKDKFGSKRIRINWSSRINFNELIPIILDQVNNYLSETGRPEIVAFESNEENKLGMLHGGAHMTGGMGDAETRKSIINTNYSLNAYPNIYICSSALYTRAPAANLTLTTMTIAEEIALQINLN
jgi:choline dehydrogenase-like flavoprotein